MATITSKKVTFYSHFASALINGDHSGLTVEDTEDLEKFWNYIGEGRPVAIDDIEYFGRPEVPGMKPGAVVEYIVHYVEG